MISTVYFGVSGRKSSLQLEWFQALPSNYWSPRLVPFSFLPTLNISAILICPKQWFFKVTTLLPKPSMASSHLQESKSPSLAIQGPQAAFPRVPASSGIFPTYHLCVPTQQVFLFIMFWALSLHIPLLAHLCLHHSPNLESNFSSPTLPLRPGPRSALPIGLHLMGWGLLSFYYVSCVLPSSSSLYLPPRTRLLSVKSLSICPAEWVHNKHLLTQSANFQCPANTLSINPAAAGCSTETVKEERNSKSQRQALK